MTDFDAWVQRTPPDPLTPKEDALCTLEQIITDIQTERRRLGDAHPLAAHWKKLESLAQGMMARITNGVYDDELNRKASGISRLAVHQAAHRAPGTATRIIDDGAMTL